MRTGRPPEAGDSREKVTCVRFTVAEQKAIDQARGGSSRSTFIRQAVNSATKKGGTAK